MVDQSMVKVESMTKLPLVTLLVKITQNLIIRG